MEASACSRSGQALSRFDASFVRPVIAGLHRMIYRLVPWPTLRFAKYKGDAGRRHQTKKLASFSSSLSLYQLIANSIKTNLFDG